MSTIAKPKITKRKPNNSMLLKDTIIEGLINGKANNIVCLDLRKVDGAVSDFFVIAHGDSSTHIEGINRSCFSIFDYNSNYFSRRTGLGIEAWSSSC